MFTLCNNEQIGEYLASLIDSKFQSRRQFGKACLEAEGKEVNNDEIGKMANRITQIIKGTKSIQTYDLPIFTELLEVTCEEILSAGKYFVQKINRATNYSIVFSTNQSEWIEFIKREDKLILNHDEYGKNAIDYAIDFKNYAFLKFLMDNKYIWFDSKKDKEYIMTFGAGTSINRREPLNTDNYLFRKMTEDDQLRMDIIFLSIENNDLKMLREMRAREITELYYKAHYLRCAHPDFDSRYDEKFVNLISKASNEILEYFTDEFEIRDVIKYKDRIKRVHVFMFPFISQVLDLAVKNKHPYIEYALKKSIKHNQETYDKLKELIDSSIESEMKQLIFANDEQLNRNRTHSIQFALRGIDFYENGNIISFCNLINFKGIITNIVNIKAQSDNIMINHLITELNELYEKICNIEDSYILD